MPHQTFPDWQGIVKDKWLLFDADALISLIAFDSLDLLTTLKRLGATFTYINPVLLELMNTSNPREKLLRSRLLSTYGFTQLPITNQEMANADRLQRSWPIGVKGSPSSTDYYLGGTLVRYFHGGRTYLLTSNLRDFPRPLYTRESFIPLTNQTDFKAICIIGVDESHLI